MGNFTFDNLSFSIPNLIWGIYNGVTGGTPLLLEALQDPLGVFNTLGKVDEKQPKLKKDITKTANTWGKIGAAADLVSSALPLKSELSGTYGNYTLSLDAGYNAIADSAAMFGPAGTIVGGAMKLGSAAGLLANNLGAGTDGMCVCAGTKIFTATGAVLNIEDLLKELGIIGWSEKTKQIVPLIIHDFIEPRQKECLEIVLKSGLILRCSIDHPILSDTSPKAKNRIINGKRIAIRPWAFRRADELHVGDFVGLANNIDFWGNKHIEKAYLIGLLIGDGTYTKGNSCRIISADKDTWDYIEKNNLGVINHCDDSRPDKYLTEVRTYRIIDGMQLMKSVGLEYLSGKYKTLPKNLGEFDKESVCSLIAGLFDTDGSISVNELKDNYSITLYQSNILLLEEVKILLHKLGIFSTIGIRKAAKYLLGGKIINSKESYRLEIHDIRSVQNFYKNIHLNISRKQDNLSRIYEMFKNKSPQEHNDISGAKQSKIVSITPIGILTVYNLLADNDHTYLANGIITHNTKTDAILGSSFLNLTPIGLANGIFGSKTLSFTKDEDALALVGGSYLGADTMANNALSLSNKKIGWLSSKKKFDNLILKALDVQSKVNWIAGNARDSFDLQNSMTAINSNRREYDLTGGYDYGTAVGKHGMAIKDLYRAKRIISAAKYLKGGKTESKVINQDIINEVSIELPEYREGGKFNVIPEGALHARKNNMEMEGITKKGIPVISESEGGEIEQQAEIERSEIIFRLEVTKKLEELAKDGSDEAAIEAGKLLTHEILHNTIDNTNSLI